MQNWLANLNIARLLTSIIIAMSIEARADEVSSHIRTIASSCASCHVASTSSKSVIPSLAGLDASYFIKKMEEYRTSPEENEVMTQHAKGLSTQEIEQLAVYFSEQSRACPIAKKPTFNYRE